MKTATIRIVLVLAAFLISACSHLFMETMAQDTDTSLSPETDVVVTYLGTSSFLVSTPTSSVLFDGYISRESHYFVRTIEPNVPLVAETLHEIGIATPFAPADFATRSSGDALQQLDAVIPLHGHYDHAMDVGVITGLTGAKLYGDRYVYEVLERSMDRFEWLSGLVSEHQFQPISVASDSVAVIKIGDINVTLFETPHSTNILSRAIDTFGDEDAWKFPTSVVNMNQGASMSAHVLINGRSFLIIPTAGPLDGQIERLNLQAETVFLGVGGLGWQNKNAIENFMVQTIDASEAAQVFPIHWDDHQATLERPLKAPFYERLDRLLAEFDKRPEVQLRSISALYPFNPFNYVP